VALIARRVQLNNLWLFRSVKYRLAMPAIPSDASQRWPPEIFDGKSNEL
jgi:hypothetical protein